MRNAKTQLYCDDVPPIDRKTFKRCIKNYKNSKGRRLYAKVSSLGDSTYFFIAKNKEANESSS